MIGACHSCHDIGNMHPAWSKKSQEIINVCYGCKQFNKMLTKFLKRLDKLEMRWR